MSSRTTAIVVALFAIGLTLAQDVDPGLDFYHTWQYAAALSIAVIVMAGYAWSARTGSDGPLGRFIALALTGALAVAIGGLAAGLLGPDTETVSGSPGSVTPVPDLGVAAFFGQAGPAAIARGDATIVLRRKDRTEIDVPQTGRLYLGPSIVYRGTRPAAFIEARDLHGNHLTVTQPQSATFLSPVLLFPNTQPIGAKTYPLDTFATPALHRIARVLYFDADESKQFNHLGTHEPSLVISLSDDAGNSVGLNILRSGHETTLDRMRIDATLGTYPDVIVAAAPYPAVLIIGCVVFAGGLLAGIARRARFTPAPAAVAMESQPH
jgi:hypothetical protein